MTTSNTWRLFWVGMTVKKSADGPAGFDSEDGTEGAESSGRRRVPTEPRFANTRAKNDWARTTSHSVTMCALTAVSMPRPIHTSGIHAALIGDTAARSARNHVRPALNGNAVPLSRSPMMPTEA